MRIKSAIPWTRSAIVLALFCAAFSFSAAAKSDPNERLDAEDAALLVERLSDGIVDLIRGDDQVTAITAKWKAREDLAGKPKLRILELLFADVMSVVTDQETTDKIWKTWLEDEISDNAAPAETPQEPVTPPAERPQAPANPPVSTLAKPVRQSSCQPLQGSTMMRTNIAQGFGFVSVGYRPLYLTGTVRCFDDEKGYGFITVDGDGTDVFVHFSAINMDGRRTLEEGQKVQFEISVGRNGQRIAVNVRAA